MSDAEADSEPQPNRRGGRFSSNPGSEGASSEMHRQMEAAKERMKKYHAVYGQPGHGIPDRPSGPLSQSEDR